MTASSDNPNVSGDRIRESETAPNAAYMLLKVRSFVGDISPLFCAISLSSRGVKQVTVDGKAMSGNVLPVFGDNAAHKVEVVLG